MSSEGAEGASDDHSAALAALAELGLDEAAALADERDEAVQVRADLAGQLPSGGASLWHAGLFWPREREVKGGWWGRWLGRAQGAPGSGRVVPRSARSLVVHAHPCRVCASQGQAVRRAGAIEVQQRAGSRAGPPPPHWHCGA